MWKFQWRIQDFPDGGVNPKGGTSLLFGQIFLKKLDREGARAIPAFPCASVRERYYMKVNNHDNRCEELIWNSWIDFRLILIEMCKYWNSLSFRNVQKTLLSIARSGSYYC